MTLDKWDQRFLCLAMHVAGWSRDSVTKVGAVLVGRDRRDVAVGYNGFPRGVEDLPERLADRTTKHILTQHAERNVLDNARFDPTGGTLYVTKFPCTTYGCSKSVVSKRLARVVCPPPSTDEPWASDSVWTRLVLREAGVHLVEVDLDEVCEEVTR